MELIFLGTSSGVPTKSRNVSGLVFKKQTSKNWYLVDCGEGTQHQLLHTKLSLKYLKAIFITHIHGDHCYGLPGLLATTAMSGRNEPLTIVAPKGIQEFIQAVIKTSDLFLNYEINFVDVNTLDSNLQFEDFNVSAIELSHRVPSFGYAFIEKLTNRKLDVKLLEKLNIPRGEIWGKLQKGESIELDSGKIVQATDCYLPESMPRKVIICGDNDDPSLLKEEANNANLIVHESTYTEETEQKIGSGRQHCSAESIAKFAESISIKNLILTHFSPRYQQEEDKKPSIYNIQNEASEHYSGNLILANDLDVYQLDKNGSVSKTNTTQK